LEKALIDQYSIENNTNTEELRSETPVETTLEAEELTLIGTSELFLIINT